MTVTLDSRIPTLETARQAAEVLAAAHPQILRVIAFGSVAAGTQAAGSDLDLMVVVAGEMPDLARLGSAQADMEHIVESATGSYCDVIIVDQPELAWNLEHAQSSVYGEAMRGGQLVLENNTSTGAYDGELKEHPPMSPNERTLAVDEIQEARRSAGDLAARIERLPELLDYPDAAVRDYERHEACLSVLQCAHYCIEKSLLAVGRLRLRRFLDNHHKLEIMVNELKRTSAGAIVARMLEGLPTNEKGRFTVWRQAGYLSRVREVKREITPENAIAHIRAAADLLQYAIAEARRSHRGISPLTPEQSALLDRFEADVVKLRRLADSDQVQLLYSEGPAQS